MGAVIENGNLKPCPFCGAEVELYGDCYDAYAGRWTFWVACEECGCRIPGCSSKGVVIEAWNTRACQ